MVGVVAADRLRLFVVYHPDSFRLPYEKKREGNRSKEEGPLTLNRKIFNGSCVSWFNLKVNR